jgi:hypothetical protein
MAKKKKSPTTSTSSTEVNAFSKGMMKDMYDGIQPKENWSHARNAANNSVDGDIGVIGNEPANLECAQVPYTIIGAIHTYGDEWVIFSTDDSSSEIGLFDDSECKYETLVNAPCLNFNRKYLITGAAKENYDCTWQVYWDDSNNPSRTLNLDDIPYVQQIVSAPGADCVLYEDTSELDCEKLRLAPLIKIPCVKVNKNTNGGQLKNGSYQAYIAYTLNGVKITDYIGVSNIQALFEHNLNAGSLDIEVTNLDQNFEEYELVILSDNQGAKIATKIGQYSTEQSKISIDFIDPALVKVSAGSLFFRTPAYEKSESMYVVNDYLIRQGPTEQFDFNYQPIANKIQAKWVVAEYNAEYYYKGGNKAQFMRDEVYAFFIRWIYNTGEKSASYNIPGRAPQNYTLPNNAVVNESDNISGANTIDPTGEPAFKVYNTATVDIPITPISTDDGGEIIRKGGMAYWESTEKYSATKPEIWNSTYVDPITGVNIGGTSNQNFDLCGKNIRHHKFPTEALNSDLELSAEAGTKIRILGVEFSDIERPKYNDGTYIENIVGYEILRGSREGAKSILAKGIFRNMRQYDIPDSTNTLGPTIGLYPNFPYNDLTPDVYHWTGDKPSPQQSNFYSLWQVEPIPRTDGCYDTWSDSIADYPPLTDYRKDIFTFHSPELLYRRPFLNPNEIRIYGALSGQSSGEFIKSEAHPQNKLLRNGAAIVGAIIGIGYALGKMQGSREYSIDRAKIDAPYGALFTGITPPFISTGLNTWNVSATSTLATTATAADVLLQEALTTGLAITDLILAGGSASYAALQTQAFLEQGLSAVTPGLEGGGFNTKYNVTDGAGLLPAFIQLITGVNNSRANIAIGADKFIELLYNLVSLEDHAFKFNSHGLFSTYTKPVNGATFRAKNIKANYIGGAVQSFNNDYKINNLFRPDTVVIQSDRDLPNPQVYGNGASYLIDRSRYCIGGDAFSDLGNEYIVKPEAEQRRRISALYGGLKLNLDNQYGQLEGVKQVLMNTCVLEIDENRPDAFLYQSDPIFSGDTYVGRHTEKVIMPIFNDFLLGQPDQYPYNYLQRINIPYPRFWMNTRKYDTTVLARQMTTLNVSNIGFASNEDSMPNDLFYLDRGQGTCTNTFSDLFNNMIDSVSGNAVAGGNPAFSMRYGYMYTHVNGILDFFAESEVNLPNRDWEDTPEGRHYDNFRYTRVSELFNAQIIKKDNLFRYDYSLSASRFITNLTPQGLIQSRDYNPNIAETCFLNYPKRLIYSLQAQLESKKDFWRVFLPNNYKDFKDRVNIIKPVNKSGAIIFFPYQSPQMFQGLDQLETDLGTKLTIGDGGLFSQPFQNLVNSDLSNEYGSCESQRGVLNTPYGFFFISQAQGKVFQQSGQSLDPISNNGMKWWFSKYLPSNLINQFPELEFSKLADNPVIGIGCQVAYDITDDILYVCKKDYSLKEEWEGVIEYDSTLDCFVSNGPLPGTTVDEKPSYGDIPSIIPRSLDGSKTTKPFVDETLPIGESISDDFKQCIEIGDPFYFDDCSWTVSYDPKVKAWISFHDWHPELNLSSINHFLTTQTGTTDTPECPPGYTYNNETGNCEILIDETVDANVSIDELPSVVNNSGSSCKYDIVFSLDTSSSAGNPNDPSSVAAAEVNFVTSFLNNPGVVAGMAAGNIQVGIIAWSDSTQQKSMNPNGFTMSNTIGPLDIENWFLEPCSVPGGCIPFLLENWYGGSTDVQEGFNFSINVLQDRAGSELGDRSNDPGFKSILIMVPDGFSTFPFYPSLVGQPVVPGSIYGCDYQSPLLGGNAQNDWEYVYSVFATPDPITSIYSTIALPSFDPADTASYGQSESRYITCDVFGNMLAVSSNSNTNPALFQSVIDEIIDNVCDPVSCDCPEGYTLVYYDEQTNDFTSSTGSCTDGETPEPICRKVECECPPSSNPNVIQTQTGECDNVYLAGTVDYVNLDPVRCSYFFESIIPANFTVGGIWRHNYRCDLFANYYGVDYPWEVELIENTGQNVNTLRSIEYQLESYVYKGDQFNACGDDRWHDLDFNFDESIIYNTEQVSGLLRLELNPKEDPLNALTYPIINTNDMRILYSKEEQKYRFNQFWDITRDRGEFSNAEDNIFITECNGYIRNLNENNLDYAKSEEQRKKFRHYYNKVLLRRTLSNNRKMLLKLANSKLNLSFR